MMVAVYSVPHRLPRREYRRRGRRGLGDQQSAQQAVQFGSVGASAAVSALVAMHLIPLSAVPFVGPALAGAALVVSLLVKNSGCGQTCIQTSSWANQAADALQKASDAYFAQPAPRSKSSQDLFINTFNQVWARMAELCGDPQWGDAGKRCISDRQRGACTWKQKYAPVHPGQPQIGECWNWFNGILDPVANDPDVVHDSLLQSSSTSVSSALSTLTGGSVNPGLLLLAGLLLVGVLT